MDFTTWRKSKIIHCTERKDARISKRKYIMLIGLMHHHTSWSQAETNARVLHGIRKCTYKKFMQQNTDKKWTTILILMTAVNKSRYENKLYIYLFYLPNIYFYTFAFDENTSQVEDNYVNLEYSFTFFTRTRITQNSFLCLPQYLSSIKPTIFFI